MEPCICKETLDFRARAGKHRPLVLPQRLRHGMRQRDTEASLRKLLLATSGIFNASPLDFVHSRCVNLMGSSQSLKLQSWIVIIYVIDYSFKSNRNVLHSRTGDGNPHVWWLICKKNHFTVLVLGVRVLADLAETRDYIFHFQVYTNRQH